MSMTSTAVASPAIGPTELALANCRHAAAFRQLGLGVHRRRLHQVPQQRVVCSRNTAGNTMTANHGNPHQRHRCHRTQRQRRELDRVSDSERTASTVWNVPG